MSTPLYKYMKSKGTSFYAFPSSASDLNLANYNDYYNLNFTKFTLLNIPQQVPSTNQNSPKDGVMDFIPKLNNGSAPFYCNDVNYTTPTKFSDQLVESLRNYVANYDTSIHESRITSNTDFYNTSVRNTPTEHIFWKWCRKLNMIDFEPAVHNVDYDKNNSDFDNPNASSETNVDYFRKYLWKEREIIDYQAVEFFESSEYYYNSRNTPMFTVNEICKFKVGDKILFKSDTTQDQTKLEDGDESIIFGTTYTIGKLEFNDTGKTTNIWLNVKFNGGGEDTLSTTYLYLDYNRLIEYVGEINQISNIQTASKIGQEVTAYIPHQGGRTPTVLFGLRDNSNYKPNLEIPILSDEIQEKIVGAESINSPIRITPQDYPGSYIGQFDTANNTYLCSNGDKLRYQGEYYGINLTDNTGVNTEDYVEKLTDFNSDDIDGLYIDYDKNHYTKMGISGKEVKNFDEFSSLSTQTLAPEDFEFNAILWYYEMVEKDSDGNETSYTNLYGIEFLNNPDNDDDNLGSKISTYNKLVTNGDQDGLSYMFNLNLHYNIDNDIQPLTYDPSTIYNMFGFDLYNEMMKKSYQVNENFINMIQQFITLNSDVQNLKTLIYSQTDIDSLKKKINSLEELLSVYSSNQFVDSDTAKISVVYPSDSTYPKLKFNVISVEYDEIKNISLTDIYNYNYNNIGDSYPITLSYSNNMLLNLVNDNISNPSGNVSIMLDQDLSNKQKLDIVLKANYAQYSQQTDVNMLFNMSGTTTEINIFRVSSPKDLLSYNTVNPELSDFDNSFYLNENIYVNTTDIFTGQTCSTGYTEIILTEDIFNIGDTIYVQNLFFKTNDGSVLDYSGAYTILDKIGIRITINLLVSDIAGYKFVGQPRISYYRGIQITLLRIDGTNTSTFAERYKMTYKII